MRFSKFKFVLRLVLMFSAQLFAQVKDIGLPEIKNYNRLDYKGGTQNWGIDQDKNNNIYFANNNGLFQFDGSTWNKYSLPNHSEIHSLKAGNNDKIYVGGYNEFGFFTANDDGKLNYHSLLTLLSENNRRQIDFIWKIHEYKENIIFQSFKCAYIYNGKALRRIEAPSQFQFSFVVNNRIIFQDKSEGLLELKNDFLIPLHGTKILNSAEVWGIFPLANDKLLISTLNKGLFIYEKETLIPWNTEADLFMKKNSCLGGVTITNDFIVLNSVLDGVIICDKNGRIVQHINQKKGLQNNTVLSSFIDVDKNLWLGLDNGISYVNESSPFSYFGISFDISTVYASVVYKENLYVATNRGLFCHYWNKLFKEDSFELVEGTIGQAWNIQVIDNKLLCAHNRGLLLISEKKTIKIIDPRGYWGVKKIPNQPNLLIGSHYNGFSIFDNKGNELVLKNYVEGYDKSSNIFEIEDDNVWIKKDDSLYKLKLSSDFFKFESIKTFHNLSKSVNGIQSIQLLNKHVYFQVNNHFYTFSNKTDSFTEDKKLNELFNGLPKIQKLFQDENGNIWYVYNESIGLLKKNKNGQYENVVYPFANLKGNLVTNYLSVNYIDPQNIFIGLASGLAHFNSQLSNNALSKPKAYIKSFSSPIDTQVFGNRTLKSKKEYVVPYKFNQIKFTFSSPTFQNPENTEYAYKLEGFDDKWSNWTRLTTKEYTNLHERYYTMNMKARNNYGIISDIDTLSFEILPPFYRHFLAYLFYLASIICLIFVVRQRIKLKIRKNKYYQTIEQRKLYLEREAKIKQEQYELENEIEQLKIENLKIKILSKDKELVNKSFQVVKKNKILNNIIHKLKEINVESLDESTKQQFVKLNKGLIKELNTENSWKDLEKHIKNVNSDFLKRLKDKYPNISPRELDLSTYLLLNMSTKEIAEITNISNAGVELARYRLRKKLGLTKKENLIGFLMNI